MQLDLMNPLAPYEYAKNPTQLNFLKAMYGPAIGFVGFEITGLIVGERITMTQRLLHSADISLQTARTVGAGVVKASPWIAGLAVMSAGVHGFWHTVRSLDWVPDYYVGP